MNGGKKGVHFSVRGVVKNVRAWGSKIKEGWKGLIWNWGGNVFCQRKLFETPLCTMCWINKGGDKGQLWEQGAELGGGRGGADTRREGLKETYV